MKPCSRTLCIEAHPIIRVPTVGPLPAPSEPPYTPMIPARSGPRVAQQTQVDPARSGPSRQRLVQPIPVKPARSGPSSSRIVQPTTIQNILQGYHAQEPDKADGRADGVQSPVHTGSVRLTWRSGAERNDVVKQEPRRSGGDGFKTPPRPSKSSLSGAQASCIIHCASPHEGTESPRKIEKKDLLMLLIQANSVQEFPTLPTFVKVLKELGEIDKNEPNDLSTVLKCIVDAPPEKIQFMVQALSACGGDEARKRLRVT